MKRKFLLVMCFLFCFFIEMQCVFAKNVIELQECEYTEEYKKYLKLSAAEKKKFLLPQMCKDRFTNQLESNLSSPLGSVEQSAFDLRKLSKITPIKNQTSTSFCWTFAANASMESNLLVNNLGEYDLSESHMELSTQNTFKLNYNTFNRKFNSGGNSFISAAYVMNHKGPVLENEVPFKIGETLVNNAATSYDTSNITNKIAKINVNDISIFSGDDTCSKKSSFTSDLKKYLVNYGAVASSMYFEPLNGYKTINNQNVAISDSMVGPYYYYSGSKTANHGITIVGWDDNISKDNFKEGNRPSEDGAWIIKNSYGKSNEYETDDGEKEILSGDEGYYYVSYDDTQICKIATGFYNVSTNIEDNAYYYDELGFNSYLNGKKDIYAGTVFTKKTNNKEKLEKVTFATALTGVKYEVYYDELGTLEKSTLIASGTVDHIGYLSVKPDQDIIIDNNKYGIIVKYYATSFNGEMLSTLPVMTKMDNTFYSTALITDGVSYISADKSSWADISKNYNVNTSIRAYTNNISSSSTTTTTAKNIPTTSKKDSETTSKNQNNEVNEDTTVEIEKNPNNDGKSYTTQPETNPSTSDYNILICIILVAILVILVAFSIRKILKLKECEER